MLGWAVKNVVAAEEIVQIKYTQFDLLRMATNLRMAPCVWLSSALCVNSADPLQDVGDKEMESDFGDQWQKQNLSPVQIKDCYFIPISYKGKSRTGEAEVEPLLCRKPGTPIYLHAAEV